MCQKCTMVFLLHCVIITSILITTRVNSEVKVIRPPEESLVIGDTFPSCVEVKEVLPKPFSHVKLDSSNNLVFLVKYSRPIVLLKDIKKHNQYHAYISVNNYQMQPFKTGVSKYESSLSEMSHTFNFTSQEIKMLKTIHLVINGGTAYSVTYAMGGYWYPFVPSRVYTYYFDAEVAKRAVPRQINPQTYLHCTVRKIRPLPNPFLESPYEEGSMKTDVILDGNKLILSDNGQYTLHIAVKVTGRGSTVMRLPSTVNAKLHGYNVTVALPQGSELRIKKSDSWYRVPVTTKIIHEVVERMYYTRRALPTRRVDDTANPPKNDKIKGLLNVDIVNGRLRFSTVTTKRPILIYFPEGFKTFHYYSYSQGTMAVPLRNHATGFDINYKRYNRDPSPLDYAFPFVDQDCDANSVRSQSYADRSNGTVHHTIELGTYFRLVEANLASLNDWLISSDSQIICNGKDVTKSVSFGGPNLPKTRVPKFLYDALQNYVVLLKPLTELLNKDIILALDEGIFVPRADVHSNCNGILYYENSFEVVYRFCEEKYGTCVGLPFTSTTRHPVIPPFGIDDWAGWISNKSKIEPKLFGKAVHPMGQHVQSNDTVPRAVYMYDRSENKRYFYLTAPEEYTDYIYDIPITGIKGLLPVIRTGCFDGQIQVDPVIKRETLLSVNFFNQGKGGTDVSLRMKCSSKLIIVPSDGKKTIWAKPASVTKATFVLDATRAVSEKVANHKCDVDIYIQFLPEANINRHYTCSKIITTYFGHFVDPCVTKDTPLPQFKLHYFVLPPSQYHTSFSAAVETILNSNSQKMMYMRTIAISLEVSRESEKYMPNLLKIVVECGNSNVYVFEEAEAIHQATLLILGRGDVKALWTKKSLSFYTSLLTKRRFYFVANRQWARVTSFNTSAEARTSDCTVSVWANRPHQLCDNPTLVKDVEVPLVEADLKKKVVKKEKGEFWYIEPIYGTQTPNIMLTLLVCVGVTVFCSFITGAGHSLLIFFEKQLPNIKKKKKLRKQLQFSRDKDKKSWETPQMFLQKGKYGPYYTLYNFKGTAPLNTSELKNLKMAGLLKFQDKELQVMFGHIKYIYCIKNDKSGDLWLQASSGWYLLKLENVHEEYSKELYDFYDSSNIHVKVKKRNKNKTD